MTNGCPKQLKGKFYWKVDRPAFPYGLECRANQDEQGRYDAGSREAHAPIQEWSLPKGQDGSLEVVDIKETIEHRLRWFWPCDEVG